MCPYRFSLPLHHCHVLPVCQPDLIMQCHYEAWKYGDRNTFILCNTSVKPYEDLSVSCSATIYIDHSGGVEYACSHCRCFKKIRQPIWSAFISTPVIRGKLTHHQPMRTFASMTWKPFCFHPPSSCLVHTYLWLTELLYNLIGQELHSKEESLNCIPEWLRLHTYHSSTHSKTKTYFFQALAKLGQLIDLNSHSTKT